MSLPAKVRPFKAVAETYHGVPILNLRVDDPIPTPRAPERYAVRVYPDLARYFLTLNHDNNRSVKPRTVAKYANDMRNDLWRFTPEAFLFTQSGKMDNGQHRCHAVIEYGGEVWMMCDFGWPDHIINAIDRGAGRTVADAFTVTGIPYATRISSAISLVEKYDQVISMGGRRSFAALPVPSSMAAMAIYEADAAAWEEAARTGDRVYRSLDRGFSNGVWIAAFRIIARVDADKARTFFEAVATGSDPSGSASRSLGDWARRRPPSRTKTGDPREPLEVILRAFNAWVAGKALAMPKFVGFEMSRVR